MDLRSKLEEILAIETDLEQRESNLAAAMELVAIEPRVRMAYQDGRSDERARVLTLINAQADMLCRGGFSHTVLSALRRAVLEGQG